jgi:hypothetical protein
LFFSEEQTPGPQAAAAELRLRGGTGTIPASAIQIRHALPTGSQAGRKEARFDALGDSPRPSATTHLVWLTAHVPADARPGDYEGRLTAAGREIPLRLKVASWKLPAPSDFTVVADFIQSPETVAMRYGVPLWSDRHFDLMGKSLDLLGRVGNKTVYIPLIAKTHFGNAETMVRWIREGGGYAHDFTIVEKYLDLCIRRMGKPKIVCFYVWEPFTGGGYFGKAGRPPLAPPVSLVDPKTGNTELMDAPIHGTPESEAFWKPVFDGLRERLAGRGLGDETFLIGIAGDSRPTQEITECFQRIAPYARWGVHSHGRTDRLNGAPVAFVAHVWGVGDVPDPDRGDRSGQRRYYGWKNSFLRTVFPRYGGVGAPITPPLGMNAPLGVHWTMAEICLAANLRGFGRVGADFWPALKDTLGTPATLINRYPISDWHQLSVTSASASLLYPGADGAASTIRFEAVREGMQEAEAKIFIEKALDQPEQRVRVGDELASRCQDFLDRRVRLLLKAKALPPRDDAPEAARQNGWNWYAVESGWQDRTDQLYALAAEVAKALGKIQD